ncbi:MAG TPA: hypothetical protein VK786_03340, partial [bacterium]|nr:hypothetical protein [bacterium]
MDTLASFGVLLAFIAVSLSLMRLALWQRPAGGLFSALPLGLLPAAAVSVALFWAMQQTDIPQVQSMRAEL